jgi:hypothetical protein
MKESSDTNIDRLVEILFKRSTPNSSENYNQAEKLPNFSPTSSYGVKQVSLDLD